MINAIHCDSSGSLLSVSRPSMRIVYTRNTTQVRVINVIRYSWCLLRQPLYLSLSCGGGGGDGLQRRTWRESSKRMRIFRFLHCFVFFLFFLVSSRWRYGYSPKIRGIQMSVRTAFDEPPMIDDRVASVSPVICIRIITINWQVNQLICCNDWLLALAAQTDTSHWPLYMHEITKFQSMMAGFFLCIVWCCDSAAGAIVENKASMHVSIDCSRHEQNRTLQQNAEGNRNIAEEEQKQIARKSTSIDNVRKRHILPNGLELRHNPHSPTHSL